MARDVLSNKLDVIVYIISRARDANFGVKCLREADSIGAEILKGRLTGDTSR